MLLLILLLLTFTFQLFNSLLHEIIKSSFPDLWLWCNVEKEFILCILILLALQSAKRFRPSLMKYFKTFFQASIFYSYTVQAHLRPTKDLVSDHCITANITIQWVTWIVFSVYIKVMFTSYYITCAETFVSKKSL